LPTLRLGESGSRRFSDSGSRWLSSPMEGKKSFMIEENLLQEDRISAADTFFIKIF
jgi:hypothetical protein